MNLYEHLRNWLWYALVAAHSSWKGNHACNYVILKTCSHRLTTLHWRAAPLIFLTGTPVNVEFDGDVDMTGSLGVYKALWIRYCNLRMWSSASHSTDRKERRDSLCRRCSTGNGSYPSYPNWFLCDLFCQPSVAHARNQVHDQSRVQEHQTRRENCNKTLTSSQCYKW